jgi:hypothetical protein
VLEHQHQFLARLQALRQPLADEQRIRLRFQRQRQVRHVRAGQAGGQFRDDAPGHQRFGLDRGAPDDGRADLGQELLDERVLAHAGVALDRDHPGRASPRRFPGGTQRGHLGRTADEYPACGPQPGTA